MDNKQVLDKIIEAGNLAPSGGNTQPWIVTYTDTGFKVEFQGSEDHVFLNYLNRGTAISAGAFTENIFLAAQHFGFQCFVEYQLATQGSFTAVYNFTKSNRVKKTDLYEYIATRHTNRRAFERTPLNTKELDALTSNISGYSNLDLSIETNRKTFSEQAMLLGRDVEFTLSNDLLHKLFFNEVLWNEGDQLEKPGLYLETVEITGPKAFFFRIASTARGIKILRKMGVIQKITEENQKKLAEAAAFIHIGVPTSSMIEYVNAGRLMQNIWLKATKLNLSIQPMLGIAFMTQRVRDDRPDGLSDAMIKDLRGLDRLLKEFFSEGAYDGILSFRIGHANPPTATSLKRKIRINN